MGVFDCGKKILRLHLIYWAVIFIILAVFLLLIAPVCVNPKAFENFSFAATLVSIVLAVVSIVYSFQSKSNTSENIAGIRVIEQSIDSKLQKFDSLKNEIVEEVKGITRPIEDEVSHIRQGQKEASNQIREVFEKMAQKDTDSDRTGERLLSSSSFYGNVMMYVLCKAKTSGKVIDLEKMGPEFGDNYEYFWGFWVALASLNGRPFDYEEKNRIITVTNYDEGQLGNSEFWKAQINNYKNKDEVKKFLNAVDSYFSAVNTELKSE